MKLLPNISPSSGYLRQCLQLSLFFSLFFDIFRADLRYSLGNNLTGHFLPKFWHILQEISSKEIFVLRATKKGLMNKRLFFILFLEHCYGEIIPLYVRTSAKNIGSFDLSPAAQPFQNELNFPFRHSSLSSAPHVTKQPVPLTPHHPALVGLFCPGWNCPETSEGLSCIQGAGLFN